VEQARVHDLKEAEAILDAFQKHGHNEIDSARGYGDGSSEEYLGELRWQDRGIVLDTKLSPGAVNKADGPTAAPYRHTPEGLRRGLEDSLKALKTGKVRRLASPLRGEPIPADMPRSTCGTSTPRTAPLRTKTRSAR